MILNLSFKRIDALKSISAMRRELANVDIVVRKQIIEYGLSRSRFQFTWSWFALLDTEGEL